MRLTLELSLTAAHTAAPRKDVLQELLKDAMHAYLASPVVKEKHEGLQAAGLLRPADVALRLALAKELATQTARVSLAPE